MKKISVWITILILIFFGSASAVYFGYQKANNEGVNGNVNIISSQAIGLHSVRFVGWHFDDVSAAAVADDGLSFVFGLALDNGDKYTNETQHIEIAFQNYGKTDMAIKLTPSTNLERYNDPCKNIYFNFGQDGEGRNNTIGQIDLSTFAIKLKPISVISSENVGIADSITRTFPLEFSPVMHESLIVYMDGVIVETEDYIADEKEGLISFYTPPHAPDLIVDADGTSSSGVGLTAQNVNEGDELEFFENADHIVTNNINNPTEIWIDSDNDWTYDSGEQVILGNPSVNDPGVNVGDPWSGNPIYWKYYDENNDMQYNNGEDIIFEGEHPDAYYFEGQKITADYQWSGEKIRMYIDVGNKVVPGFYEFKVKVEPTNWDDLNTENM